MDGLLYAVGAVALVALLRRLPPGLSWRRGVAYAVLVFAFYGPALLGPATHVATDIAYQWRPWSETLAEGDEPVEMANPLLSDIPFQMLPFRTLVRERFLDGEVPLWAHEMNAGMPLLGNGQSAPFAPLHFATLPLPPARALTVAAAWQTLAGLLLMHLLVLAVGRRDDLAARWGATVGAVAFALSTYAVAWAYHPLGMVAMGVPGVVLGIVFLARGTRGGFPLLVAVAVGMAVSGHPETVAHTAVLSAGLAVVLLARVPQVGRGRFVARLAGAAVLSALLAAPALLPLAQTLPGSERMEILDKAPRAVAPPAHEAADWLPTFQPLAFGSPRYHDTDGEGADYAGRSNFNELCSQYAGALTLVLALLGALVLRGRVLAMVLTGLGALLVSFRVEPLYSAVELLPLVGHAAHGRLRLFWVLAVALAAGIALPRLLETRQRRTALAVGVAGLAIAIALVPPPVAADGLGAIHPRLWFALVLAGLGLFAAALALSLTRRLRDHSWLAPRRLAAGAALLLGAELFVLGVVYHPLTPPGLQLDPPPALAFILERNAEALDHHEPFRVLAEGADLVPNLAAAQGLWDPRSSNDPARPFEATWLLGRRLSQGQWQRSQATLLEGHYDAPFHQMLGVRYVLTRHREPLGPPYRPVFDHQGGKVWELDGTLPLFWVPGRVDAVDPQVARRRAVRNRGFSRRGTVTVEDGTPTPTSGAQEGTAEIVRIHGNGFDLVTRSAGPMVVASSVVLSPGWRVTVDGEPARPVAVNWVFLGFEVPAGEHRVELVYSPTGWRWGLVLFGVGVLVVVLLLILRRR